MKRRVTARRERSWPQQLLRYDPAEWPDGPQAWYDAREAWDDAQHDEDDLLPLLTDEANAPDVPWDGTGY